MEMQTDSAVCPVAGLKDHKREEVVNMSLNEIGIGFSKPCFIIAEVGQNHQGDLDTAKKMIRIAKKSGANCVKFQKSNLQQRFTKQALESSYNSFHSFGSTYGEHRARLEFSEAQLKELQTYASQLDILFLVTPMDIMSVNLLIDMKMKFFKIGSGDTNNFPLIEHIAKTKLPIILSTGMQTFDTVRHAHDIILQHHKELVLLHCVSAYPTEPEDINLAVMDLYQKEFPGIVVGYSGHEKGIHIAVAAVARGAKVIEKHFTLDKSQKGSDHQCSLEPPELANLVQQIREVEAAIGTPFKRILSSELPCMNKLGKSIVSARKIDPGEIHKEDLAIKVSRPAGMKPELIQSVVGLSTKQTIEEDTPITVINDVVFPILCDESFSSV